MPGQTPATLLPKAGPVRHTERREASPNRKHNCTGPWLSLVPGRIRPRSVCPCAASFPRHSALGDHALPRVALLCLLERCDDCIRQVSWGWTSNASRDITRRKMQALLRKAHATIRQPRELGVVPLLLRRFPRHAHIGQVRRWRHVTLPCWQGGGASRCSAELSCRLVLARAPLACISL